MNTKLQDALRAVFELTGAASLELHSGDREPGRYVRREDVVPSDSHDKGAERSPAARAERPL